jgi:integrase
VSTESEVKTKPSATTLTEAAVRKFKAKPPRRRWIRDGGSQSLFLVIHPGGRKSWVMRFRGLNGRPVKLVLGRADVTGSELKGDPVVGQALTLVAARQKAAELQRQRALGIDVAGEHRARKYRQRAKAEEQATNTYGVLVRKFIEDHARPNSRSWRATARLLGLEHHADQVTSPDHGETKNGLADRWRDKLVRTIDGHLLHGVIDEAQRVGVPGIEVRNRGRSESRARNLHAALSSFFSWCLQHRHVDSNPCRDVWHPKKPEAGDRVLNETEIGMVWRAADGIPPVYAAALRLLVLTGCRLREVCNMQERELSGGLWTIPGRRTKNELAHQIALPALARELIECAPRIPGSSFVFTTTGTSGVNSWSRVKARLDAAAPIPPWALRDLRRTCVTGMANIGIAPHIIEACVNHVSGAKASVAGVYNKAAYALEKQSAFERWAHYVTLVVDKELHAAHERFLAADGTDESRARAHKGFINAIGEGGQRWADYLTMITTDNVTPLPQRRRT